MPVTDINNSERAKSISPGDWPLAAEQRYARLQARLADHYDLDVESRTIDTDAAGRIHYLVAGDPDGDPVLLLHGLTVPAAGWMPMLPALADGYRLYLPDMPGEGLSAKPSYRGRVLRSFLVGYLIELLDDVGLDRPNVVANSFGGAQAFLLAIDHDRVDRLCLVGAPVGLSLDYPWIARLLSVRGANHLLMWLMNLGDPVRNARRWIGRFVIDDSTLPDEFHELYAVREELPGLLRSQRSLLTGTGSFGRISSQADLREEVVGIERPTAFIWGTEDYYWGPDVGRAVADRMSNAAFYELPGLGHVPWLEPGDAAESRVRSFLDG